MQYLCISWSLVKQMSWDSRRREPKKGLCIYFVYYLEFWKSKIPVILDPVRHLYALLIITKVIKKICFIFQETYRRWACSTMVPLWVEEGSEEGSEETGRSRRAPAEHAARWHARHLERVGHLDRRRGGAGGVVGRWVRAAAAGPGRPLVRLKPCLSVCQLVEQHCPYFLPADRAPAYPTQYAGEPTFLCLGQFS